MGVLKTPSKHICDTSHKCGTDSHKALKRLNGLGKKKIPVTVEPGQAIAMKVQAGTQLLVRRGMNT